MVNAEFETVTTIVAGLKPVKIGLEKLCSRNAILLTAEGVFSFVIGEFNEQNLEFVKNMKYSLIQRINERRNVNLIGFRRRGINIQLFAFRRREHGDFEKFSGNFEKHPYGLQKEVTKSPKMMPMDVLPIFRRSCSNIEHVSTFQGSRDAESLLYERHLDYYLGIGPCPPLAVDFETDDSCGNCPGHLFVGRIKGCQMLNCLRT
ncbi:uncharacterized protein TNCV_1488141 [Trichonephila clavipes]|nr:uncharacterized protein TNCV_1488141 [Trichonephila clavipes]